MENTVSIQSSSKSYQCCKVDYTLLPLKVFNFFYFGAVGSIIPFLTVYLKHLGLTAPETGFITGCSVLLASLVRPLLGLLADTLCVRRGLLLLCCLLFGAAFSTLWFLPQRNVSKTTPAWSCTHSHAASHACARVPKERCQAKDGDSEELYNAIIFFPQCQLGETVTSLNVDYDPINEQYFYTNKVNRTHYEGEKLTLEAAIRQENSNSGNQKDGFEKDNAMKDRETLASTNSSTSAGEMTPGYVSAGELTLDVHGTEQNRLFLKLRERPGDHQMRETVRKLTRMDFNITCSLVRKRQPAGVSSFRDDTIMPDINIIHHTSSNSRQTEMSYEGIPVVTTSTFPKDEDRGDVSGTQGSAKSSGDPLEIDCIPDDSFDIQHVDPYFGEQGLVTKSNASTPHPAGRGTRGVTVKRSGCRCHVFTCKAWELGGDNSPAFTPDVVFGMTLFVMAVARAFYSSSSSLLDAVTYIMLNANRHHWGRQRMWGTVGTATAATVIMSANITVAGDSFGNLFLTGFCLVILTCIAGLFLKSHSGTTSTKRATGFGKLQAVLRKMSVLMFLGKILFFGILCGSVQNFAFWFLRDLGADQTALGACLLANCLSSVVVLRCAAVVLRRVGETRTMYLVLPVYAFRFIGISVLQNPWLAVPLELLHGWTYSLLWAASSASTHRLAPSGAQALCQGIAGAIYWDLGRGLGSLLTGYLFRAMGARWTFRLYGAASLIFLPFFCLLDWRWPSAQSQEVHLDSKGQELELVSSASPEAPPLNGLAIGTQPPAAASLCQQDTDTPSDNTRFIDQSSLISSEVSTVTAKLT